MRNFNEFIANRRHALLYGGVVGIVLLLLVWTIRRWRIPLHEEVHQGTLQDADPMVQQILQKPLVDGPLSRMAEGTGAIFHRTYTAQIVGPQLDAHTLMARVQADLNTFAPHEIAVFEKKVGDPMRLAVGDEYNIRISGPWNGPVRVLEVMAESFTFGTLEGHLEAGEIMFCTRHRDTAPDVLYFTIESWSRSQDMLVDLVYDKMKLAQKAQTAMWSYFLKRVVEESGGELASDLHVHTEKIHLGEDAPSG